MTFIKQIMRSHRVGKLEEGKYTTDKNRKKVEKNPEKAENFRKKWINLVKIENIFEKWGKIRKKWKNP